MYHCICSRVNQLHYVTPLSGFICYSLLPLKWSDRIDFLNLTTLGGRFSLELSIGIRNRTAVSSTLNPLQGVCRRLVLRFAAYTYAVKVAVLASALHYAPQARLHTQTTVASEQTASLKSLPCSIIPHNQQPPSQPPSPYALATFF